MRAARPVMAAVTLAAALAACGPVPRARAEAECFERARLAVQPRGEVYLGAATGGTYLGGEIRVSSDFVQGRDPSEVYTSCVIQRSGEPPSRPLYDRPDWKG